jgi:hypothetical protein
MGLDDSGLLIRGSLLLGLAQFLDQTHGLALQSTGEPSPGTRVHNVDELVRDGFNGVWEL